MLVQFFKREPGEDQWLADRLMEAVPRVDDVVWFMEIDATLIVHEVLWRIEIDGGFSARVVVKAP